MQVKFLTIYTKTVKSLVNPVDMTIPTSLALVIGTSNNLYKVINEGHKDHTQINSIIIDTWLELIEPLIEKVNKLSKQVGERPSNPMDKSAYLRFELYEKNRVAQYLLQVYEQLDRALIVLEAQVEKGFNKDKQEHIVKYFTDKVKVILTYPYQQNKNLNEKLLHLNS